MMLNNQEQLSAVSMSQYGIETVVLTEHKTLMEIEEEFRNSSDSSWMNGKGKVYLYAWLKVNLLKEDKYFTAHPDKADVNDKRWIDFCDDCVNFAVLAMLLYRTPIHLVHPDQFNVNFNNLTPNGTNGNSPSLIEGIECVSIN